MINRFHRAWQRRAARWFARRIVYVRPEVPIVSFTFDDFPFSAYSTGGKILEEAAQRGTYYVALGLAGSLIETGRMFSAETVTDLVDRGHELGCHTYDHCPAWETPPAIFEASVERNRRAARGLLGGHLMTSLSYPISYPRPATKRKMARRFGSCRGGGQQHNIGSTDLNYLRSAFIEQWRDTPTRLHELIERNAREGGWLIFSTHDVAAHPTDYGCTPQLLSDLVARSIASGAKVMTVGQALAIVSPEC